MTGSAALALNHGNPLIAKLSNGNYCHPLEVNVSHSRSLQVCEHYTFKCSKLDDMISKYSWHLSPSIGVVWNFHLKNIKTIAEPVVHNGSAYMLHIIVKGYLGKVQQAIHNAFWLKTPKVEQRPLFLSQSAWSETLIKCRFNLGPMSQMLGQH